ncbi:hypothetical protein DCO48_10715 [Pseudomonas sp. SDI]|uniref:hypothetical protein n=1 Tax=Pseudomonas sp. SDI TaxID=2170734 RepID=UPI000DE6EE36|nr:hypothetical protein [Pseudomonas sp. SDI]PWB33128.1 hypothetical protein DCO48_10715 [Pseudomonas sp. SDI]
MFGQTLVYGVYHLAIYLLAALTWLGLCLAFLFNAHLLAPRLAQLGRYLAPTCALLICLGLLALDIWALYGHETVEYALLSFGIALPAVLLAVLCRRVYLN